MNTEQLSMLEVAVELMNQKKRVKQKKMLKQKKLLMNQKKRVK